MNDELKVLLDTMSKVGDYGAITSSEAIFQLLEVCGCDHFKVFGTRGFEFPSLGEMPATNKTVDTITKIILRKFCSESDREHTRKKAAGRLAKVLSLNPTLSLIVFIGFECIVFLMCLFSHSFILTRRSKLWNFESTKLCMVRMRSWGLIGRTEIGPHKLMAKTRKLQRLTLPFEM
jgi:hypothetical protein